MEEQRTNWTARRAHQSQKRADYAKVMGGLLLNFFLFIGLLYALLPTTRLGLALGLGLGLGLLRRLCGGTRRLDRQCHPVLGRPVLVLAEAKKMVASSILELEHVAYLDGSARRRGDLLVLQLLAAFFCESQVTRQRREVDSIGVGSG